MPETEDQSLERGRCSHPSALLQPTPSLVTGHTPAAHRITANLNRMWPATVSGEERCGPEARYFEMLELVGFR
jgi:hypothetical protein